MKKNINDLKKSVKKIFLPVIALLDTTHFRQKNIFDIITTRKGI